MGRLIPLLIVGVFLIALDWYIFKAIKTLVNKKDKKVQIGFSIAWWLYTILLFTGILASIYIRSIPLGFRSVLMVMFVLSFVTKLCYLPFPVLNDLRNIYFKLRAKKHQPDIDPHDPLPPEPAGDKISRSDFILKAGLVVASIPFGTLTWGIASGAYNYQLRHRTLYLENLPKAFDGIKLAQLSDIHSGSFFNKKAVLGGIEMLMGEKPDFVFFTGDLVNSLASEMRNYQDLFSKVNAPLGVYSVLGNHDYGDYHYGPYPTPEKARNLMNLKQTHKNMGWDLLLNENRSLKIDGEEIAIVGVENWGSGARFPKLGDLPTALNGTEDKPVKLLLSHDPTHWREHVMNHPGIDVTFSGHTHGMQFGVRTEHFQWSPVEYIYNEWAGLYQEKGQQLYVNVGYGFLGYPGRVGILPEITIFELKRG